MWRLSLFLIIAISYRSYSFKNWRFMRNSISNVINHNMFSGIVEEMGRVEEVQRSPNVKMWDGSYSEGVILKVSGKVALEEAYIGCSIAVNGVCLTATEIDYTSKKLTFGIAPETLRRSNIKSLNIGDPVNIERALKNDGRNSGHVVQGHVDCTGKIIEKRPDGDSLVVKVEMPKEYMKYIVSKGFIAVDGTSLTICEVGNNWFTFMLVSHTQQCVIIPQKQLGDEVNIEVDVLAKMINTSFDNYVDTMLNENKIIQQLQQENRHLKQQLDNLVVRIEQLEKK